MHQIVVRFKQSQIKNFDDNYGCPHAATVNSADRAHLSRVALSADRLAVSLQLTRPMSMRRESLPKTFRVLYPEHRALWIIGYQRNQLVAEKTVREWAE